MYVYKKNTKAGITYYLCKSYRDINTGKSCTKIVEKLGTEEEIRNKYGQDIELEKWLNEKKKETKETYKIEFNAEKRLTRKSRRYFNIGYFPLQKICYQLKIDKVINEVKKRSGFKGDLTKIFLSLIYDQIIYAIYEDSHHRYITHMIEDFQVTQTQVAKAIKIFSEYSTYIQTEIYKNTYKYINYDCSRIYNECVHYCYDLSDNKNSFLEMVRLDIFSDKNGIPLVYVNSNASKEQKETMIEALNNMKGQSTVVTFSDNLPSDIVKNCELDVTSVEAINTKLLKKYIKDYILDSNGWRKKGTKKIYNLEEINKKMVDGGFSRTKREKYDNVVFYKVINLKDRPDKQLVVGFNYLTKIEDEAIRNSRYEYLKDTIDKGIINQAQKDPEKFNKFLDKFKKFLKSNVSDDTQEASFMYEFNDEVVDEDARFDGIYTCICDKDIQNIEDLLTNKFGDWMTDYLFSSMKMEFKYISKYSTKEDNINAHLLLSYVELIIIKIFTNYLEGKYNFVHVQLAMSNHNFIHIPGIGWIPAFIPTNITEAFDNISGIHTDYEFISENRMKEIIAATKNDN